MTIQLVQLLCPRCDDLVEPVSRIYYVGIGTPYMKQGPLVAACPQCDCRLLPTAGEMERTRSA